MERSAGVFLHPTSLPSPFGIGDLGESAYRWVDLLSAHHQQWWQMCPLGPTGYGDSPYQCLSTFAGNTLLISPQKLCDAGLLTAAELAAFPRLPVDKVDFGAVIIAKEKLFRVAYARFVDTREFYEFCQHEKYWLDDYALFRVIKEANNGRAWCDWDSEFRLRYPAVLDEMRCSQSREIRYHQFLQFMFFRQWSALKKYVHEKGVRIIGDIPIYVAYDSCDAWSAPDIFEFDENGKPLRVAGVPPDYFSETGQLWGNPIFRWDTMRAHGYIWWVNRLRKTLELVDLVRLDHFRGFESFWAVPADSKTAISGEWVPGPGIDFFNALKDHLGALPLIAEDLGEITHGVEELRRQAGMPGMKILQFAFGDDPDNPYLPYNINADSVVYTGTHDNNTTLGWFLEQTPHQRDRLCRFTGTTEQTFVDGFVRMALMAASQLCIIPLQDILGLDGRCRMNTPGKAEANWSWRVTAEDLNPDAFKKLADYTDLYGRKKVVPIPVIPRVPIV